jgi:hypothetical protein
MHTTRTKQPNNFTISGMSLPACLLVRSGMVNGPIPYNKFRHLTLGIMLLCFEGGTTFSFIGDDIINKLELQMHQSM